MKPLPSSICVLAVVGLAACSNSGGSTTLPSSVPTTLPSSISVSFDQTVCDIRAQVLSIVGQIQASALPPIRILGIGARVIRNDDDRLVLIDEHGRRLEEIPSSELSRPDRADGSHTVAMFPALPDDARTLTLVVPGVVIKEGDEMLELELPVTDPIEARFGPYPVRIASAKISDDVRSGPGEPPKHGVEVRFGSAGWYDEGRVLHPERIRVGEIERSCGWGRGRDPEFLTLNVQLPEGTSAGSVTLLDPVLKIRGPWEIEFTRP